MELAADEPWVGLQLDHLDQRAIRRQTTQVQAVFDELFAILVVDFVTVSMALADLWYAVNGGGLRTRPEATWVSAQTHRPAHVGDVLLVFHERDYRIVALGRELAGVAVGQADHVAGELDDCRLHSQADAEKRQTRFA